MAEDEPAPADSPDDALADVLAYLARKRRNAATMLAKSPQFEAEARWSVRQIDVFTGDLKAGLHQGEAQLAATEEHPTQEQN